MASNSSTGAINQYGIIKKKENIKKKLIEAKSQLQNIDTVGEILAPSSRKHDSFTHRSSIKLHSQKLDDLQNQNIESLHVDYNQKIKLI